MKWLLTSSACGIAPDGTRVPKPEDAVQPVEKMGEPVKVSEECVVSDSVTIAWFSLILTAVYTDHLLKNCETRPLPQKKSLLLLDVQISRILRRRHINVTYRSPSLLLCSRVQEVLYLPPNNMSAL